MTIYFKKRKSNHKLIFSLPKTVNILITLGSERLYSDLSRKFSSRSSSPSDSTTVLRIDKSGGCVDRSATYMRALRHAQIREYFFGKTSTSIDEILAPSSQSADFDDLNIFRLLPPSSTTTTSADYSLDMMSGSSNTLYEKVNITADELKDRILAVTTAGPKESGSSIRDASVRGYLYVAEVDEVKRKVRLLSPQPGQTPGQALVVGVWPEGVEGLVS